MALKGTPELEQTETLESVQKEIQALELKEASSGVPEQILEQALIPAPELEIPEQVLAAQEQVAPGLEPAPEVAEQELVEPEELELAVLVPAALVAEPEGEVAAVFRLFH